MTGDEFVQVAFFWVGAVGLVIVLYRRPHTAKTLAIMLPFAAMIALFFRGCFATVQ
jgi:hypothetical protein